MFVAMMTKKHFVTVARRLRGADYLDDVQRARLAEELGGDFHEDNPNFDLARFFFAATGHSLETWLRGTRQHTTKGL